MSLEDTLDRGTSETSLNSTDDDSSAAHSPYSPLARSDVEGSGYLQAPPPTPMLPLSTAVPLHHSAQQPEFGASLRRSLSHGSRGGISKPHLNRRHSRTPSVGTGLPLVKEAFVVGAKDPVMSPVEDPVGGYDGDEEAWGSIMGSGNLSEGSAEEDTDLMRAISGDEMEDSLVDRFGNLMAGFEPLPSSGPAESAKEGQVAYPRPPLRSISSLLMEPLDAPWPLGDPENAAMELDQSQPHTQTARHPQQQQQQNPQVVPGIPQQASFPQQHLFRPQPLTLQTQPMHMGGPPMMYIGPMGHPMPHPALFMNPTTGLPMIHPSFAFPPMARPPPMQDPHLPPPDNQPYRHPSPSPRASPYQLAPPRSKKQTRSTSPYPTSPTSPTMPSSPQALMSPLSPVSPFSPVTPTHPSYCYNSNPAQPPLHHPSPRLKSARSTSSVPRGFRDFDRNHLPRAHSARIIEQEKAAGFLKMDDLIRQHEALKAQVNEARGVRTREEVESGQMLEVLQGLMGMSH
ncbi:hypothetical protein HK104_004424 [Borealophlyctis nickersoniae]|nr:hypothetical protein HK104_004424 [Borealophlyctis nickersoniae]